MYAWIRTLEVSLTSTKLKKKMVFGTNRAVGKDDLFIDVRGHKYMSMLKDECVIKIKNLTMSEVVQIIDGQYYDVEVKAGYRSSSTMSIFNGGVLYISNEIDDRKSNTIIILCASKLVARYGQSRINLTLNSGINIFSAINFVCKRAAIPNTNVSTQFKKKFLQDVTTIDTSVAGWLDQLCANNETYIPNSDAITEGVVSIFDAAKSDNRVITLREDNMILQQYPQLDTDGLSLKVMPTFNFMCGDTIKIDNSIIQIPVTNKSEISKNYGYFLDKDGCYMIYQMQYALQNRGPEFNLQMLCKSRSLISKLAGDL